MRYSKKLLIAGVAGLSAAIVAGKALADHGKVGLWSITVAMDGNMVTMPDLSKLPPDALARMKAMGMSANGNTVTMQHCMSAADVAANFPDIHNGAGAGCAVNNVRHDGHSMSADLMCNTDALKGSGHAQFQFDSETHYSGEISVAGVANGHPVKQDEKIEGRYLTADCGKMGR
jgi:hypothetical protein